MSSSGPAPSRGISLDQLIALNHEIASLVRAGIPIELGLAGRYQDLDGRLGRLTQRLIERMRQGATLPQALAAEEKAVPPIYRAVVEAGVRMGRLPEALEALTRVADSLLDVRRRFTLALLHPLIVLTIAYCLGVVLLLKLIPLFSRLYRDFRFPMPGWMGTAESLQSTITYWGPVLPILVGIAGFCWLASGTVNVILGPSAGSSGLSRVFSWFPGLGGIRRNLQFSVFSELLSMLVEHRVPLPEALLLAGDAAGNAELRGDASLLAGQIQTGKSLTDSLDQTKTLPSFMRWMMKAGEQQGSLAAALKQVHEVYRRRGIFQAERFNLIVPVVLVLGIGGTVTLAYGVLLFLPMRDLLSNLSLM